MKLRFAVFAAAMTALLFAGDAAAQNAAAVRGPVKTKASARLAGRATVGYLTTSSGTGIQPIVGVAGASRVVDAIDFGLDLSSVALSPAGAVAIGVAADSGKVTILSLEGETDPAAVDAPANPDRILFSPSGNAAGLYYRATSSLIVVSDIELSAAVSAPLSLEGRGVVAGLAVADSGLVLAAYSSENGVAIHAISEEGARYVADVGAVADLRFMPNSTSALITDPIASRVTLINDLDGAAGTRVIGDAESGLKSPKAAISNDGETVFVISSGAITALDIATGEAETIPCRCSASGFEPVGRGGRYHLTGGQPGAIALLDDRGDSDASIILVPARETPSLVVRQSRIPERGRGR